MDYRRSGLADWLRDAAGADSLDSLAMDKLSGGASQENGGLAVAVDGVCGWDFLPILQTLLSHERGNGHVTIRPQVRPQSASHPRLVTAVLGCRRRFR